MSRLSPDDTRLLQRWLTDHAGRVNAQARLCRDAFRSSRSKDAAERMAEVHEQAAGVYARALADLGGVK